eukprot:5539771-Alexandrium_andersonii.AAC.1
MRCPGSLRQRPKLFPRCLRQRRERLCLRATWSSINACSGALPKPAYARTPAARASAQMSGGQMVSYTGAPRAQSLRPPSWPADVL